MAKILIVDDSEALLETLEFLLGLHGYEVETASSKNTVLNRLSTFIPDVILLDVRLNGESGRELCREIKEQNSFKHIPVILLSASPHLLQDYEECKAFGVIEKPFNLDLVVQKIEGALKHPVS